MKEYTEKEWRDKAEAYCSAAERCPAEVAAKLRQWGADEKTAAVLIAHLLKERFLDESRYCRAFVRDKYRFNQWGRVKIAQALRLKQLPPAAIEEGLLEIDEDEYADILRSLITLKLRSVKAANDYDRNAKLIRYAVGKGYGMDELIRTVKNLDADELVD